MQSAWTAAVWGGGKTAQLVTRKLKEGEEECFVCRDDVAASVKLCPCFHTVCFNCVEQMRAKNIFKADKGVKCPFCRQYIDSYEPVNSADPAQVRALNEANRAAAVAAAARTTPAERAASGAAFSSGAAPSAAPAEDSWMCTTCRTLNLSWREECNSCGRPNPRPKAVVNKSKDVLKCSDDEVIGFIKEKGHPHLNRCFLEMGLTYSNSKVTAASSTSIVASFKQRGEERFLKVLTLLAEPSIFVECATHFLGNYTVQDMSEGCVKLREAMAAAPRATSALVDAFKRSHGGRDPLGALIAAALPHTTELAVHEKGTYVIQHLVEGADGDELITITNALFANGPALAADQRGVFALLKCLEALRSRSESNPALRLAGSEVCARLCTAFSAAPDKLRYCLHNHMASKVVAGAVAGGLPHFTALRLGSRSASHTPQLMASKHGVNFVLALLGMQSPDVQCDELLRDLLCTVAMKLQGGLVGYLLRQTSDDRGPVVVRLLVERMAQEQEIGWLDAILQELINHADAVVMVEEALEVLQLALCSNVLDDDTIIEHLQQMRQMLDRSAMEAIEQEVCSRRDRNPLPPPPRFLMPSVLQPDLKYMLMRGYRLPRAPPPPKRTAAQLRQRQERQAAAAAQGASSGGGGLVFGEFGDGDFGGIFGPSGDVSGPSSPRAGAEGDPWSTNGAAGTDGTAWGDEPWAAAPEGVPAEQIEQEAATTAVAAAAVATAAGDGQVAGQQLLRSLQFGGVAPPPAPITTSAPAEAPSFGPIPVPVPAAVHAGPAPAHATITVPQPYPSATQQPQLSAAAALQHQQPAAAAAAAAVAAAAASSSAVRRVHPLLPGGLVGLAAPPAAALYQQQQQQQHAAQAPVTVPVVLAPPTLSAPPQQQQQGAYHGQVPQLQPGRLVPAVPTPVPVARADQPPTAATPALMAAPVYPRTSYQPYSAGAAAGVPAAPAPRVMATPMPLSLALVNPALAVLANTSGLSSFGPRAGTRPPGLQQQGPPGLHPGPPGLHPGPPGLQQQGLAAPSQPAAAAAGPAPPMPSVSLMSVAGPSGGTATVSGVQPPAVSSVVAAAAAAMAAKRMGQTTPSALPPSASGHGAALPPTVGRAVPAPAAAAAAQRQQGSAAPAPAAAAAPELPTGPWQCNICTYKHAGPEQNFLACAICGCERGLQQLPS